MKRLLLTAFVMIGFLVSARANIRVVVSIRNQTAWLVDYDRILMTSPVSTAKRGMHTPTGHFKVSEKDVSHMSTIYHVPMPYYMRLSGEPFGMHAGYLPGYPASHGCVRMPEAKAISFFQAVSIGTPVNVFGTTPRGRLYQANYPASPTRETAEPYQRPRRSFWDFLGL